MNNAAAPQLNRAHFARLVNASRVLNATEDLQELLTFIIREAAALTGARAASILLLDPHTRQLHFRATSDKAHLGILDVPVPLHNSVAGDIFRNDRPLIVEDAGSDPRWNPDADEAVGFRTDAILGVPMHDVNGEVTGVLEALNKVDGTFDDRDVETLSILADLAGVAVARARLVAELRRANRQLNELDQLKSKFIAIASHELRTPLSIILAHVSTLREQAGNPRTAAKLDRVLDAAIRLRTVFQDILNLQYVDANEPRLHLESFNLTDVVTKAIEDRTDTARAKELQIVTSLPDDPVIVRGDRGAMDVIIGNLLNNAVKFTPHGGDIRVAVEEHAEEVWLRVRDSGIGIPADKLDLIFNRFYQVEPHLRRSHEGLGLGLAVARDLLEAQHGRIWARNNTGAGSEFFVALPLNREPGAPQR